MCWCYLVVLVVGVEGGDGDVEVVVLLGCVDWDFDIGV